MATWKKVLLEGDIDLTAASVSGNEADLIVPQNSGLSLAGTGVSDIGQTQHAQNVLIGADAADVTLKIDIMGTAEYSGSVDSSNDFLLIHDATQTSGSALRRVSVSDLADSITSGTTDITFTGDSGTTNALDSNASVLIEGGTGIDTVAAVVGSDSGKVTINANVDPVIFTGTSDTSTAQANDSGMIRAHGDNFEIVFDNVLKIKSQGVTSAEIANGTIMDADINANAGIDQDKIDTFTATHKVSLNALNIENGAAAANSNAFDVADKMVFYDASDEIGSGAHNYTGTIQQFQDFISDNVGGVANAHADITGAADVTGNANNLQYIKSMDFDQYGHVLSTTQGTIPNAGFNQAGIVTATNQTFSGVKRLDEIVITDDAVGATGNLTVEGAATIVGNTTIQGDLIVEGETTTLNVGTLNVEDKDIVGAVPAAADAYATNVGGAQAAQAGASAGGFFLASHHGTDTNYFAGFQWKSGNSLTGWTVRDTASTAGTLSDNFCVAVMDFDSQSGEPTVDSAGVGSFLFNTADDALYIRTV